MSHHRETVTAAGAPNAAGPYSHAVKSNGARLSSPARSTLDPETGTLVEGPPGRQGAPLLDNLSIVAAAAGGKLAGRGPHRSLHDRHLGVRGVNEAYATYFEADPPARTTIGVASLPLGAEVEMDAIIALS